MSDLLLKHFDLLAKAPDGVARLRELILTLAVQGKLVRQVSNDEPASVLLQRIRVEKDRLIAEGKIKRDKPLPPITDEEKPFELPMGWEWVRLGELCSYIQRGKGPVYAEDSAHRVISQKCVRWYGLDLGPARFITAESLNKYESIRFLQSGDLLWNSTGTGTIGRACLVPQELESAGLVADSHVTVVRPVLLDGQFLWRWIQSPYVQDEIEGSASGTTNQIELNTSTVINHLVPLAPLEEQSRIVARVEELLHLCDALEAKCQLDGTQHAQLLHTLLGTLTDSATPAELAANWQRVATHFDLLLDRPSGLDALEQTILQLAVRGLLVPQDPNDEPASVLLQRIRAERDRLIAEGKIKRDKPQVPITEEEKPFDLPLGWEWVRLGEFSEVKGGKRLPAGHSFSSNVTPHAYIQVTNMKGGTIIDNGIKFLNRETQALIQNYTISQNDLYITIAGTIGQVGIVPPEFHQMNLTENAAKIVSLKVDRLWLREILNSGICQTQFTEKTVQQAQPKLALHRIASAVIPLPPVREQSRIVARVEDLRQLCNDLRQRLSASRTTQGHLAEALVADAVSLEVA